MYSDVGKILIIKPSSLGDIVHALPVLSCLKKMYPGSYIAWLVFKHFKDMVEDHKYLDEVIVWEKGSFKGFVDVIKTVRSRQFDLIIDLQGLLRTAVVSRLSGAQYRLGCPGLRELSWLFEREIEKFDPEMHAVDRNLRIVRYLGGTPCDTEFAVPVDDKSKMFADSFLQEHGLTGKKILGMAAAAGIPQKRWPEESFSLLCDTLSEKLDCGFIFFGSAKEEDIVARIQKKTRAALISSAGKTDLKQLSALIERCSVFVGNDTGILHIAGALGVPVVGLYGPSRPAQVGPYQSNAILIYKDPDCGPCGIKPGCKTNICMQKISTDEVAAAVMKQLQ